MSASDQQIKQSEPGSLPPDGFIPLSVPNLAGSEWKYVKECFDTGWVSSAGPFVQRFEEGVAAYLGAEHAIATASGTAALHVALLVAGIKPDEEVLVPALTFIAPANAVRYVRAWPVFVDVEADHWQLDPQKTLDFFEKECMWRAGCLFNKRSGRRVRAVLPVDLLGHPVDMDAILAAAEQYGLVVIEDATESLGARYKNRNVGNLGNIACLSFNGNKIMTTGGGGMIVTDNAEWAERARYLTTQAKDDALEYIHHEIGYNYRMTNLAAAVGCGQLERLDQLVAAKRRIAAAYERGLSDIPGIGFMREADWAYSTWWMYTVLVDEGQCSVDSRQLLRYLGSRRIQARPLWQPMHLSPAYNGVQSYHCDTAKQLWERGLSLPCSTGLTESDQQSVIATIRSCMNW